MKKIKILVVDDSALMRKIISDMINEESDMEVIETARNGEDLLNKLNSYEPDIITLDVEMNKMDGITTLKKLKEMKKEYKIIILSSLTTTSSNVTLECLELGAVDFIGKPSGSISLDINKVKSQLVSKIREAYKIKRPMLMTMKKQNKYDFAQSSRINKRFDAIVIGASTGGPKALYEVVTNLPSNLGVPIFIVQHMPKGFTKAFADRLNNHCNMEVFEAHDGQIIEKNKIYVAPGGYHLEVGLDKKIFLNEEPPIWGVRPAVDKLFISASRVYKDSILSIVLTGMGRDGANGTAFIKDNGGYTIAEDESTCTIYGMPKATFETGKVDEVIPLYNISRRIVNLLSR